MSNINTDNMTAKRLQQEIDGLKSLEFILVSGRAEEDSEFLDFWKIDHTLDKWYTVSGPDFIIFGERLTVERKGDGFFKIEIANESGGKHDIVGWCYIKNIRRITISTSEVSA